MTLSTPSGTTLRQTSLSALETPHDPQGSRAEAQRNTRGSCNKEACGALSAATCAPFTKVHGPSCNWWPASGKGHRPVAHVLAVPDLTLVGRWRVRVRPKEGATTPVSSACLAVATFWNVVQASLEVACILHTESSHPAVLWEASITDVVKARQPRHKVCSSTLSSSSKKKFGSGATTKKKVPAKKKRKKRVQRKGRCENRPFFRMGRGEGEGRGGGERGGGGGGRDRLRKYCFWPIPLQANTALGQIGLHRSDLFWPDLFRPPV